MAKPKSFKQQAFLERIGPVSGEVFFVDSNNGTDDAGGRRGRRPDEPFATWDYAYNQCTANNGDVVVLLENHTEDIAATSGVNMDTAGVRTVGLGTGENRPVITFSTATAADIDVGAADNYIENIVFKCNIASQVAMITVAAAGDGFHINNCEFLEGSATGVTMVLLGDADGVIIENSRFWSTTAGNYDEVIHINAALDRLIIRNCVIRADCDDAAIHNPTGNVATNLLIAGNVVENLQTGDHAIELVSACTGYIVDNRLCGDTAGTILDPGSCRCLGNLESAAIDAPGQSTPVAVVDDAANILGADNNNNAFASTNVVRNADGSIIERLESIEASLAGAAGVATYPAAAAAANAVSVAEVVRYISELQVPRIALKSTGDLTAFGTSKNLFTVTGDVLCRVGASVDVAVTSTSGTTTLEVGVAGNTAALCVQDAVDNTAFAIGDSWSLITAADNNGAQLADEWLLVGNGATIILTGSVDDITAGDIDFYCQYIPLTASSAVAAA